MNFPTVALANLTQLLQEKKRVGIVIENKLTAIAPSHHVIDRTGSILRKMRESQAENRRTRILGILRFHTFS